jgi:radical SAM superfamily enzyme YgiQ (UPF0313 family)
MNSTFISFCDLMRGKNGYSNNPMNPPPSESYKNVIQFELTTGCSHNRCTFCNMYKDVVYQEKTLDEFQEHVDVTLESIPQNDLVDINRIFIGGGNAFGVDLEKLINATRYALYALAKKTQNIPRRLSIYANTLDILKYSTYQLKMLNCGGTCGNCSKDIFGTKRGIDTIYWGIESGSDKILKIIGKGFTSHDAKHAGFMLRSAEIRSSVMIIPGLGGTNFSKEHVSGTVELLNIIRPTWITFMSLSIKDDTPYLTWMKNQNFFGNRELTNDEIVEQTAQMVEQLSFPTTIGIHGDDVHKGFCHNPSVIGSQEIFGKPSAGDLADYLRREYKKYSY